MYMLKRKYMYNILLFKKKEEKMSGFQMLCIVDFQDRRERINESVSHEVQSIFKGKTTNQLLLLEEQIKKKLQGGEGVDVGQWMRWHHNKNGRMSLTDHQNCLFKAAKIIKLLIYQNTNEGLEV